MSSVDNRIVKMGFDGSQFESGIKNALGNLDKLKSALKIDGSGLDSIRAAAGKIDMRGLAEGVAETASQFGLLDMMGLQTLYKLGDAVTNFGLKFAKSVTFEPIISGFQEYETKMGAITTIMTNTKSKGTTLDDVNKALADLNEYADLTIYNFAHMTQSVGTFTAAGVGLEDSVTAIKGFANLAAGSGVDATKMSGAMVQLSQALATGKMQLMDWKSMEQAGMGSTVFQDALKDKARSMGVFVDDTIAFRDTLQKGWLTNDILLATLADFENNEDFRRAAQDVKTVTQLMSVMQESVQSGWSETWEYIIGNKDQATEFLTGISNGFNEIMDPIAEVRNAMFKFWNENGGRAKFIEGLGNIFGNLKNIIIAVGKGIAKAFPPDTGEGLIKFSEKFAKISKRFVFSEGALKGITNVVAGLLSLLRPFVIVGGYFIDFFFQLISFTVPLLNPLISLVGVFGAITNAVQKFGENLGVFAGIKWVLDKIIDGLYKVTEDATSYIDGIINKIYAIDYSKVIEWYNQMKAQLDELAVVADKYLGIAYDFLKERYGELSEYLKTVDWIALKDYAIEYVKQADLMGKAKKIIADVNAKLISIWSEFMTTIGNISDGFKGVMKDVYNWIERFLGGTKAKDILNSGILGVVTVFIVNFIKSFGKIADSIEKFMEGITGVLDSTRESLEAYQKNLKAKSLMYIATAVALLAASLWLLSTIDIEKLGPALGTVVALLTSVVVVLKKLQKMTESGGFKGITKVAFGLIGVAIAVLILASALKKLSKIDPLALAAGTAAVMLLIGAMVTTAKKLSEMRGQMIVGTGGLIALAIAVYILAGAVKKMGALPWKQLVKGLAGLMGVLAGLFIFLKLMKNVQFSPVTAVGIVILAGALYVLTGAIALMAALPVKKIIKGVGTMAMALGVIVIALNTIPADALVKAAALFIISHAMNFFATTLGIYSLLPWNMILTGLAKLGVVMIPLIIALRAMGNIQTTAGAASLFIVSFGLIAMARALGKFENISWGAIIKGLVALAGTITILGIAAVLLGPTIIPVLGTLAGALAGIGMGVALLGAGIYLLGSGLALLAISGAAGVLVIGSLALAIAAALPVIATGAATAIIAFKTTIMANKPALIGAMVSVGEAVLSGLRGLAKPFAETMVYLWEQLGPAAQKTIPIIFAVVTTLLTELLNSLIQVIENFIVRLVQSFFDGWTRIHEVVIEKFPAFADSAAEMMMIIMNKVEEHAPMLINKFHDMMMAIFKVLNERMPELVDIGIKFILNVVDGITRNMEAIKNAARDLIWAFLEKLASLLVDIIEAAFNMIISFLDGLSRAIDRNADKFKIAAYKLVWSIIKAMTWYTTDMWNAGKDLVLGFVKGISDSGWRLADAVGGAVRGAIDWAKNLLKIKSPSRVFAEIGKYTMLGGAKGIADNASYLVDATGDAANSAIDEMASVMGMIADVIGSDLEQTPVIRPVLDLTDVQNGTGLLNGMLASGDYRVGANLGRTVGSVSATVAGGGDSTVNAGGITNTFYITGDNANDIANQVSRVIQRQVERRDVVWA